ncbi:hypothetical protein CIB84_005277 [Bambusicola thoracicus]|uniref:Uncharacterized protein n=1 Tax=Bambusicola thoracicus TaxID=9083 RepID=A0A2P4T3N5_BAMTH|nr:hypothetical protein CIB84_005277 [Bambusicola thoracicus]
MCAAQHSCPTKLTC